MKKLVAILLSFIFVFLLAGCSEKNDTAQSSDKTVNGSSVASKTEDTNTKEPAEETKSEPAGGASSKENGKTPSKNPAVSSEEEDFDFDYDYGELELSEKDKMLFGQDPDIKALSVKNKGNSARIANLMKRASKGGKYVIAVLGGSISEGAGATNKDNCYGKKVEFWWKMNFPKAEFTFVNAGIGSTNSEMAVYRMEEDLLKYKPDFVIVDFAVNTYLDNNQKATYSTILYNILKQSNNPGVMSIYFTACDKLKHDGGLYIKSSEFPWDAINSANNSYNVPAISYHNYIWNKIDKKVITWPEIGADYIHPNNDGHQIAANLITDYLEGVLKSLSGASTTVTAPSKPADTSYLNIGYANSKSTQIISARGFTIGDGSTPTARAYVGSTAKNGELKVKLPAGAKAYLFIRFSDGATGEINISGNSGNKKVTEREALTPTLVYIGDVGNEFTLSSTMKRGSFTLYGIAYKK